MTQPASPRTAGIAAPAGRGAGGRVARLLALAMLATCVCVDRSSADSWGGTGTFVTDSGWHPTPVHATLLPDGRVLMMGQVRASATPALDDPAGNLSWILEPTPAGAPTPNEVAVTGIPTPVVATAAVVPPWQVDDTLFCAGHTLLPDGRYVTFGGTRTFFDPATGASKGRGLDYATLFDGHSWTRVASRMVGVGPGGSTDRWYPTATQLPDGRVLVTGGFEVILPISKFNVSVELFDPADSSFHLVSPYGVAPGQIWNQDYTHVVVLPDRIRNSDLLMFGTPAIPVLAETANIDTTGIRWALRPRPRPDSSGVVSPNWGTSTALLPIRLRQGEWGYVNGSVFMTGGNWYTPMMDQFDVFDPTQDRWLAHGNTGVPRKHPDAVLLPDGRIAIVNGHATPQGDANTRRVTYVDPAQHFAQALGAASQEFVRGYHNIAVLLPDGRVLVGGGRDDATTETVEKPSFDYLSPDYMDKPRPKILGTTALDYGAQFGIAVQGPAPAEVVLMALGSQTHSFDMNQRYVQLELASVLNGNGFLVAVSKGPRDTRVAPPGYYMLFVLDANRVPSVARIVQLRAPGQPAVAGFRFGAAAPAERARPSQAFSAGLSSSGLLSDASLWCNGSSVGPVETR